MHSIELIDGNGKATAYKLPAGWKECTLAQLGTVAALTSVGLAADASAEVKERAEAMLRLQLFRQLTGMSETEFAQLEVTDLLVVGKDEIGADRVQLLPWVGWALEEPSWPHSLVPELVLKGVRWQGPRDGLERWTLKQWGFADALLMKLAASGKPEDLHHLLAALYHPATEAWTNTRIEEWAGQLAELDDRTKLAAILNYRGLRTWLASRYRKAFRGGKPDEHGLRGMAVRLAGAKFGTTKEAYDADVNDVLTHVEQSLADAEEQKRNQH